MDRKTSSFIAAGTVATALGIGAVMQYWPGSETPSASAQTPIVVTNVQEVSSTPKPDVVLDTNAAGLVPVSFVSPAVEVEEPAEIVVEDSLDVSAYQCAPVMSAQPAAGAMIAVSLTAPCHGNERVTVHHNGLMFTDLVASDGTLQLEIPALTQQALVIASFLDGTGAVAQTEVTTVPFYERVVLQWRGDAGLQLHAREFDAEYFTDGHVWHGADTGPSRATQGEGGFLTALGKIDAPDALMAEVYTFPTGMTQASGTVVLTVEAEIQNSNCNSVVEAQTLEIRSGRDLQSKELTIDVPSCETVGDFLMLKNLVEDLTIAAN